MTAGRQPVDGFGQQTPLSEDSIVDAAGSIVDDEGLDALTMRRLGRQLGVEAMSIYHHVPNKSALLRLLVARRLGPVEALQGAASASETLEELSRWLYDSLTTQPELRSIAAPIATRSVPTCTAAAAASSQLVSGGFDPEAAAWIVEAFVGLAVGHAVGSGQPAGDPVVAAAGFETGLRFMLAGLRAELV